MVTSFSSKSEIALNLSTDRQTVTFMGYLAPIDALDVSNSNTPGVIDPTNPVAEQVYRVVAELDRSGHFRFTETNAYSGNNGRAAIMNAENGARLFYTAGNAGNGGNPQPNGIIIGAGAQIMTAATTPLVHQTPGDPTPVGSFSITQLGLKADKVGKDTNFRGLTIFNNVVYLTKGSGGNGINTVYFIDTTGFNSTTGAPLACPNGVGVPGSLATLPTAPISYNAAVLQTQGVVPYNMCILKGLPDAVGQKQHTSFPFGRLVCQCQYALRRRRRQWDRHLQSRRRTHSRRPRRRPRPDCRNGFSTAAPGLGLRAAGGIGAGRALHD